MRDIDSTCIVWDPAAPRPTAATIVVDREDGISLDVIGSLDPNWSDAWLWREPSEDELQAVANAQVVDEEESAETFDVLHGVLQSGEVTLLQVVRMARADAMPGHTREHFRASYCVRGAHLADGLDTLVQSVSICFDVLGDWWSTSQDAYRWPGGDRPGADGVLTLSRAVPPTLEARLGSGDVVRLNPGVRWHSGPHDYTLTLRPVFEVVYAQPTALKNCLNVIQPFRWLLSLATRRAARLINLRAVDAADPRVGFDVFFPSTEPPNTSTGSAFIHPFEMSLSLSDLDFSSVIPRWFELSEDLRVPMALMFANWFSTGFMENRLVNVTASAESLGNLLYPSERTPLSKRPDAVRAFIEAWPEGERDLLRSRLNQYINDPSLRERLQRLAAEAGTAFTLVVTDIDDWAGRVVRARNDIAHGKSLDNKGPQLRALADSLEHLVEVHLLMQLGLDEATVTSRLRDTPRTKTAADLVTRYLAHEASS